MRQISRCKSYCHHTATRAIILPLHQKKSYLKFAVCEHSIFIYLFQTISAWSVNEPYRLSHTCARWADTKLANQWLHPLCRSWMRSSLTTKYPFEPSWMFSTDWKLASSPIWAQSSFCAASIILSFNHSSELNSIDLSTFAEYNADCEPTYTSIIAVVCWVVPF